MKLKSELYKQEQKELCDKIIQILDLKDNQITLYELDNDKHKTDKIMRLMPELRKYYSFNNIKAISEPKKIKRPWLSIIKQISKIKYNISAYDFRLYIDKKEIRTRKYIFELKN